MSEKGTYSDPRCYACMPADEAMGVTATVTGWNEDRLAELRGPKPYRTSGRDPDIDNAMVITENPEGWREVDGVQLPPITWAEDHDYRGDATGRINSRGPKPYHTGRYDRAMNYIADAINKRIPGPEINSDVLRNARSE